MKVLVHPEKKILFGMSCKCGSTHLRVWIFLLHGNTQKQLKNYFHGQNLGLTKFMNKYQYTNYCRKSTDIFKKFDDYYKFLVIRNPYTRIVSAFLHRICMFLDDKEKGKFNTFEKFVNYLYNNRKCELFTRNIHLIPQMDIYWYDIHLPTDFWNKILDVDELIPFITELNKKLNVSIDLKEVVNSQEYVRDICDINEKKKKKVDKSLELYRVTMEDLNNHKLEKDYSKYYNDDLKQKVYDIYKYDFEYCKKLGYDYKI